MLNIIWLIAFLGTSAALAAGVEERFPNGIPSVPWGTTLEEIQATYPRGVTVRMDDESTPYAVAYTMPDNAPLLGFEAPVKLVNFVFSNTKKLVAVFYHFDYSQREAGLYNVSEVLGQDYTTCDEASNRRYRWKPGRITLAQMNIGVPPLTWAYLVVAERSFGKPRRADACR